MHSLLAFLDELPPNKFTVLNTLILTLGPILTTVVTYLLSRRDTKPIRQDVPQKLDGIHVLVNGRLSAALAEIEALKARAEEAEAKLAALTPPSE